MTKAYRVRIAWERFNGTRALVTAALVLVLCLAAFFFTARPAVAGKTTAEKQVQRPLHKYYTAITVRQGDTLWSIAERQLEEEDNASEYAGTRAYMKEVITLNKLKNGNYLLAGQKLIIPYYADSS